MSAAATAVVITSAAAALAFKKSGRGLSLEEKGSGEARLSLEVFGQRALFGREFHVAARAGHPPRPRVNRQLGDIDDYGAQGRPRGERARIAPPVGAQNIRRGRRGKDYP